MYRSEVISVLYEQNFISFYINTLGPFSRALSQMHIKRKSKCQCCLVFTLGKKRDSVLLKDYYV